MIIYITVVVRTHLPVTIVPILMTILNWLYEMNWSEIVKDCHRTSFVCLFTFSVNLFHSPVSK